MIKRIVLDLNTLEVAKHERVRRMFDKVVVIGAGGTGSMLLPSLSRFLRSIKFEGDLVIVDGDSYSPGNLDRQILVLLMIQKIKPHIKRTYYQIIYLIGLIILSI